MCCAASQPHPPDQSPASLIERSGLCRGAPAQLSRPPTHLPTYPPTCSTPAAEPLGSTPVTRTPPLQPARAATAAASPPPPPPCPAAALLCGCERPSALHDMTTRLRDESARSGGSLWAGRAGGVRYDNNGRARHPRRGQEAGATAPPPTHHLEPTHKLDRRAANHYDAGFRPQRAKARPASPAQRGGLEPLVSQPQPRAALQQQWRRRSRHARSRGCGRGVGPQRLSGLRGRTRAPGHMPGRLLARRSRGARALR
jgi:hypothetical protein